MAVSENEIKEHTESITNRDKRGAKPIIFSNITSMISGDRLAKEMWIVSIVNTTGELLDNAQAEIVIEGITEKNEHFIGQYGIRIGSNFYAPEPPTSDFNTKSRIIDIECRGTHEWMPCYIWLCKERSQMVDKEIRKGKAIALVKEPHWEIIYKTGGGISYTVELGQELLEILRSLSFDNTVLDREKDMVSEEIYKKTYSIVKSLGGFIALVGDLPNDYRNSGLRKISRMVHVEQAQRVIESIHADKRYTEIARDNCRSNTKREAQTVDVSTGEPIQYLRYQKLGEQHPVTAMFGNPAEGDNSMGWCLKKLAAGNIKITIAGMDRAVLPKPPKPSCAVL